MAIQEELKCVKCGSKDLAFQAAVYWDELEHLWETAEIKSCFCNKCQAYGDYYSVSKEVDQ